MKTVLYGVVTKNQKMVRRRLDWRISLDFAVDEEYWRTKGEIDGLLIVQPRLSLGWASVLRQYLIEQTWEQIDALDSLATVVLDKLTRVRQLPLFQGKWEVPLRIEFQPIRQQVIHRKSIHKETIHEIDSTIYIQLCEMLRGRMLTPDEVIRFLLKMGLNTADTDWMQYVQVAIVRDEVMLVNGMGVEPRRPSPLGRKVESYQCRRCGSGNESLHYTFCAACGRECPYCEGCLTMGRVRFCSPLIIGKLEMNKPNNKEVDIGKEVKIDEEVNIGATVVCAKSTPAVDLAKWHLSKPQEEAVRTALSFLKSKESCQPSGKGPSLSPSFLIWAVAGAGKTEMIFPLIEQALQAGGRVLVATPRKDVVKELEPRIGKAFPYNSLVALYGGSGQTWESGDITLATTHQLIRFWRYFDFIVIDELDAFPYHNNPMLEYAVKKACKWEGSYVLLSATPPESMQSLVRRDRLPHVKVPVRFHGHPLPVPFRIQSKPLQYWLWKKRIPRAVLGHLQSSISRGAQVFLFIPRIEWVEPLVKTIQHTLGTVKVAGTSSKDAGRATKVQAFRDRLIQVLVTTTILERGVTVKKSDVFIVDADAPLFDAAALVQMAGRAGRSADDPAGRVYFCSKDWSVDQKRAIRQIRSMNRMARAKGYIKAGM